MIARRAKSYAVLRTVFDSCSGSNIRLEAVEAECDNLSTLDKFPLISHPKWGGKPMFHIGSCVSGAFGGDNKGELTVLSLEMDVETVP